MKYLKESMEDFPLQKYTDEYGFLQFSFVFDMKLFL